MADCKPQSEWANFELDIRLVHHIAFYFQYEDKLFHRRPRIFHRRLRIFHRRPRIFHRRPRIFHRRPRILDPAFS